MRLFNVLVWALALLLATPQVGYPAAAVFSGSNVKILKDNLDFNGKGRILSGTTDPTSSATSAPIGSLYINTSNGNLYRKLDAGSSTNWQRVGSTSGIAGSLLTNPDWETGTTGWTASGGTYTRTTTAADVGSGVGAGSWDPSASSQTLTSDAVTIPAGLYGRNGVLRCNFKTAATDDTLQVYDGSNVLASVTVGNGSTYRPSEVNFIFPSSGTIAARLLSNSNSVVVTLDDCYIGDATNITNVSQALLVGEAYIANSTNCTGWARTNTALGDFSSDADCSAWTVSSNVGPGTIATANSSLPQVTVTNLPPGIYEVELAGMLANGSNSAYQQMAVTDGTTTTGHWMIKMSNGASSSGAEQQNFQVKGVFVYTTAQSSLTFKLQGAASSGTVTIENNANTERVWFRMKRFPSSTEKALSVDNAGWRIDANISGANIDLGTSAQSSYVTPNNASLSLTQNTGSATAWISCSSTNDATGTTCSAGSEEPGISFTIPYAGDYLACASFGYEIDIGAAAAVGNVTATFQVVETANTSQTITQQGKGRALTANQAASNQRQVTTFPQRVCGTFSFTSVGRKTLRLMYEQAVSGTVNVSRIDIDGDANSGQPDFHWEVYPISRAWPLPIIVGGVSSNTTGQERVERVQIAANGTTINSQSGSWVSSSSKTGTGDYTLTIAAGIFSAAPQCTCTTYQADLYCRIAGTTTATSLEVFQKAPATGTATDAIVNILCMGAK